MQFTGANDASDAAISAEYVALKQVASRNAWQIVLEVDACVIDSVYRLLGFPDTHVSKYVAVAKLREEPKASVKQSQMDDAGNTLKDIGDRMDDDLSGWLDRE